MTVNLLQVKQLLDEHLGSSIQHKKNGEFSYHCPFCNHYKPKLQINLTNQKWHCWVCNSRGLSLTSLLKKSNAPQPTYSKIKELYGETRITGKSEFAREIVGLPEHYKPLYVNHNTPDYRNALHYIMNVRKLSALDILRYQIGYCEEGPYAGMIIIPSFDEGGNINFYVGRSYYSQSTVSHKNPPVTKDIVGFESQINWDEPIIIVEGAFDAMATKRNVIPLFGKAIHPQLKNKIVKHTKKLYLALDKDAITDALDYVEYFLNHDIEVYLVNLPGKDPSELGYGSMVECLQHAEKVDFFKLMTLKLSL